MDEYCALEEFFSELSDRFFNENENFVSQNWMPGFFIVWIHMFRNNNVYVLDCLRFLEDLKKYK